LVKYLTATLKEAGVDQPLIDKVLALLGPLESQVVEKSG
jgi:hypothetical protein